MVHVLWPKCFKTVSTAHTRITGTALLDKRDNRSLRETLIFTFIQNQINIQAGLFVFIIYQPDLFIVNKVSTLMYILSSGLDNKILNALRMEKMELTEQNCVVSEANHLRKRMMQDLLAADLQLSLFVGASQSFKYESLLKPVPNHFKKADGEVDIDKLRKLILKLPRLDCDNINKFDSDIVGLLKTVLLSSSYKLASIPLNTFKAQLSMKIDLKILPKWIFQVDYAPSRQESWERSKSGRNVFFAYHGSRYENFHSILSLGLHQHLNKVTNNYIFIPISDLEIDVFQINFRLHCLEKEFIFPLSRH